MASISDHQTIIIFDLDSEQAIQNDKNDKSTPSLTQTVVFPFRVPAVVSPVRFGS
jgi:hypothetical protein